MNTTAKCCVNVARSNCWYKTGNTNVKASKTGHREVQFVQSNQTADLSTKN
jgi:hypothetical protein